MDNIQEYKHAMTKIAFGSIVKDSTDEQNKFVSNITEKLMIDKNTNKVNVVPAPCGFGKSVLIKSFLKSTLTILGGNRREYKGDGFVIVTDLLERFDDYSNDETLKQFCYMMYYSDEYEEGFQKQVIEQNNYPILLISTQKYFKLNPDEKDFIFKYKNGKRKTVIFDEKPIFYNVTEIDKEFINTIDNEIDYIRETDDKKFLDNELKFLRDYLEQEKAKLSDRSEEDIVIYWKGTRDKLTTDDARFLKLSDEYLSPDSKNKVRVLKDILQNGALFVNKKNNNVSDNRRMFFTINDNREDFFLKKNVAKFWIFDATADIDIEYKKDYINMIDVEYTKDFLVNIRNVDVGTSRNSLNKKGIKDMLYGYIDNNFDNETLIVSYKKDMQIFKEFKGGCLGGIKGSNDFRHCTDMAQIGLNRFSDIAYLQKYLYLYEEHYNTIKKNPNKSEIILNELLRMEYGNFTNEKMNDVMYSMLLVDTEQNIFRTKLRNYSNRDDITVALIYNSSTYKKLNEMLALRLGIDEIKVDLPTEVLRYNILSRENKKESVAQRVVKWFDKNDGYGEIRTKEILEEVGINSNQFKDAKKDNKSLVEFMDNKRIKRGIYVA